MPRATVAFLCALAFCALGAGPASAATARSELARLHSSHAIDDATYKAYDGIYVRAYKAAARLSGRRRNELRAVLATVNAVAARGGLTVARLPMAFLTIDRNRAWWTTGRLLRYGERVLFKGSDLVWQSYPGQGIQVQWLATFGRANALFTGHYDQRLAALLAEATDLAAPRAGGLAWEYWFSFDGGRPPWVSGLAQGTAIQALSRAGVRLADQSLFATARAATGIFRTAPPEGVRVATADGAHYLIYSFAPRLRVLNAFIQSLNGLFDLGKFANDDPARQLFTEGEAEARVEVPRYDTGAWSLYSPVRESDLGYHRLLRDFLQSLCTRLTDAKAKAQTPAAPTGGAPAAAAPVFADPGLYCDTAARFTRDLVTKPALAWRAVSPSRPRARHRVRVPFSLSKISTVTVRVTNRGRFVAGYTARAGRGVRAIAFTPRRAGSYAVTVRAVDLAGNGSAISGAVRVRR